VGVYEILDHHNDETFPNMREVLEYYKGGLDYYRKGLFSKAESVFVDALLLNPDDKLTQKYITRCSHLALNPPEHPWDGVWVLTSK
jgi:adenylate cyclase